MKKILLTLVFAIFVIGCTKTEQVPDAVKNLERFKYVIVEHPNTKAPSFTLSDASGSEFTDQELKGKVYIIQGFTPGCSSCAREIATLNKVHEKFKDKNLEIISIDIGSNDINGALDTKERFNGGDWLWTFDSDDVAVKLQMKTLESTYIIDKEGIIRYKDESLSDSNILSQEIEKLI
ncbi:TlpA family protein disulfide reductase [Candidatus Woesearchaeota archaeon]|nr:TlpA family protein disulfide reductase [Candidatus Woesearchaeota archaeon]